MRKPVEIPIPTVEELEALENVYRNTKEVRLRTRAQIILLAGEQRMSAPAIASIVRENDQTVRNWLKRYLAEGIEGLKDRPMPGAPSKITKEYEEQLLFCGTTTTSQLRAAVFDVDTATSGRLYG